MKSNLERLIYTGAMVLPLLGGCTANNAGSPLSVAIDPQYPTAGQDLDCVVMEEVYLEKQDKTVEVESDRAYVFHWLIDGEEVYSEQVRAWSCLPAAYTAAGQDVLCSVWVPESGKMDSYELGAASVYIE